ncbi:MAG TPA: zinc ABC transporter substrate-binding protein [Usitatibacter sp.]|nr:zinc ABC transporter substrate-binding protein [Usitatibacter sp.]
MAFTSRLVATLALLLAAGAAHALSIFATVPEWGALAQELGGDKVKVYVATTALQDPHRIEARPSLIARARSADLVVATGAELEVGWLPLVLQQVGKPASGAGYFEATSAVPLLDKPAHFDRAEGDVHPFGDPHIQTDPRNIARVATALAQRMGEVDRANAAFYAQREKDFAARWNAAIAKWEQQAAPLKGVSVVVQHKGFTYLEHWLGLREAASLEPKPGIEPTAAHLAEVLAQLGREPVKMVLRAAYQSDQASLWLAERAHMKAVMLPFTVGGTPAAKDLFGLFDDTVQRLLQAAR